METFPASIEAQLDEAGFSGSEIIILRHLLAGDAVTVREVCTKTGKSPGVIDQAMKKLLQKKVIKRQMINGVPKYALYSVDVLHKWVKDDMKEKQQMIVRRYENFEAFISTLKRNTSQRPEMEFYEGENGIKKAYMDLLERGKVFLQCGPMPWSAEDDPLREFRAQFFHECHKREIYTRVITHDNVNGRRFKSRDPFEYRETLLVDETKYPFQFQKIIAGDTVACFHLEKNEAYIVHYADLAEDERVFFERIWHKKTQDERMRREQEQGDTVIVDLPPTSTRLWSQMRDFFFAKKSLITLGGCTMLSAIFTAVFFWQVTYTNLQRIREQVKSVAATGALQFEAKDLDQLHTKADITKPEYAKVIGQLNAIRDQNDGVEYLFIMRPTLKEGVWEFVADADSLNPDEKKDVNGDGKIDNIDHLSPPGELDSSTDIPSMIAALQKPYAAKVPFETQWGTLLSAFAPIHDSEGRAVAILGVDKLAQNIYEGVTIRNIILLFFATLLVLIVLWLTVFDPFILKQVRSYMTEEKSISAQLLQFFFSGKSLLITLGMALLSGAITFALYQNNAALNLMRIQEKVLSIAATGALQFDAKELDLLRSPDDIGRPEYAKTIYLLNAIRKQNEGVKYAYIMRPTKEDGIWEFVADADSLDPYAKKDLNADGLIDAQDHLSPPGEEYDAKSFGNNSYASALIKPTVSEPGNDQWGNIISGWAPIKNASGATVAVFGIDKFSSDVKSLTSETFQSLYYFIGLFLLFIIIRLSAFNRSLLQEIYELAQLRRFVILVSGAGVLSLIITFALYAYTQSLTLARMKDKVLAIAVTATSQFNADDIQALQTKDDWQKPEWRTIGSALQRIKKENPGVMYAYIIRKTKADPTKMEFAGDGDSINPFANTDNDPSNDVDMNGDGIIDGSPDGGDYQSWPGQPYPTAPAEAFDAYKGPVTSSDFYEDQWGKVISGYAPIEDRSGTVVAVLAIDMGTDMQSNLTNEVFAPVYVFIVFFALFILFRLKGFSASLLHQLLKPFRKRLTILIILFCITLVSGAGVAVYHYTLQIMYQEIGTRLMSIAATAAPEFDAEDIQSIRIAADMKTDAYQRVFKKLNEIRKNNENIQWVYIYRPTDVPGIWSFVADADSNYYVPFENALDPNDDGVLDSADENVYPGMTYNMGFFSPEILDTAFIGPTYSGQIAEDQWGMWLSGYAPIRDMNGKTVAILGLDMDISEVSKSVWNKINLAQN